MTRIILVASVAQLGGVGLATPSSPLVGQQATKSVGVGAWSGVAWQNPRLFGEVTRRDLFVSAVQLQYPMKAGRRVGVAWTVDFFPVLVLARPRQRSNRSSLCEPETICVTGAAANVPGLTGVDRVFGMGLAPLGMEGRIQLVGPLSAVGLGSGGLVWFADRVPHRNASKLNFIAQMGFGIQVKTARVGMVSAGYRFLHVSNGGAAAFNPGLDVSVWFLGLKWWT